MTDGDLTLWGVGTPRTMRAHWMLLEFGLDYRMRPIGARTGETRSEAFLALNPKHKIPVLEHGPLVLSESAAIVTYISERFAPPAGFFIPRDVARRAALNEWCFFIMTELDAHTLYLIRRHADLSDIYGTAPEAVESAKAYFGDQITALVAKFPGDRDFLMPEGASVADILLTTCLESALRRRIPLPAPLLEYRERMTARPAWRRAFERNYPERTAP
jgi:glutathione S-transferase